jgi:hypothetical protein
MSDWGKSGSSFLPGILLGVILVQTSALTGEATPEDSPATGELHIGGSSVTKLTLADEENRRNHFRTSGAVITLPPGKYRLFDVALEGGYTCWSHFVPKEQWITIAPGRVTTLKVGAPLRQIVRVERRGRSMVLNYELRGRGGERYAPDNSSERPTFTVYKGKREVASGNFEYG